MPGETNETIEETAKFLRYSVTLSKAKSPFDCSINYAQALPGTPLYKYARHNGFIGKGDEEEERYLSWVSDKNAANDNFIIQGLSGQPQLRTLSWRSFLTANLADLYIKEYGWRAYVEQLKKNLLSDRSKKQTGYFNEPKEVRGLESNKLAISGWVKAFLRHPVRFCPSLFVNSRLCLYSYVIIRDCKNNGLRSAQWIVRNHISRLIEEKVNKNRIKFVYESLRKTMTQIRNDVESGNDVQGMLRKGRW